MAFERYCLAGEGIEVDKDTGVVRLWLARGDNADGVYAYLSVSPPPTAAPEPAPEPEPEPEPEPGNGRPRIDWSDLLPPGWTPPEESTDEPLPEPEGGWS